MGVPRAASPTTSARLSRRDAEWHLTGTAEFASDGRPCRLDYVVVCDADWRTLSGRVAGWVGTDGIEVELTADAGRWRLNGVDCPAVAGCMDLDLNFSPSTNLLPIRRLKLGVGVECRLTPPCRPGIRFLFVGSEFRPQLPSDSASQRTPLLTARGSGHLGPQRTSISKKNNMPTAHRKGPWEIPRPLWVFTMSWAD